MVIKGKIADINLTKPQKNRPRRLEIIFKTKAKTLRDSRDIEIIIN